MHIDLFIVYDYQHVIFPTLRGPRRTKNPKHLKKVIRAKIVHTSGTCFEQISKHLKQMFKPCSHIEFNTTNPNPTFKISFFYTQYTNNAKMLSNFWKLF